MLDRGRKAPPPYPAPPLYLVQNACLYRLTCRGTSTKQFRSASIPCDSTVTETCSLEVIAIRKTPFRDHVVARPGPDAVPSNQAKVAHCISHVARVGTVLLSIVCAHVRVCGARDIGHCAIKLLSGTAPGRQAALSVAEVQSIYDVGGASGGSWRSGVAGVEFGALDLLQGMGSALRRACVCGDFIALLIDVMKVNAIWGSLGVVECGGEGQEKACRDQDRLEEKHYWSNWWWRRNLRNRVAVNVIIC